MPRNTGTVPPHDLVDFKFRNGKIKRGEDPKRWNWKPLVHKGQVIESDYDILEWQLPHKPA